MLLCEPENGGIGVPAFSRLQPLDGQAHGNAAVIIAEQPESGIDRFFRLSRVGIFAKSAKHISLLNAALLHESARFGVTIGRCIC
jgi:hypothetical protein